MTDIQEAIDGVTTSLEHTQEALDLTPGLRDAQTEAVGFGGVAQSQLETAVDGLQRYVDTVAKASGYGNTALDDSEKVIHIYTHAEAASDEMDKAEDLAQGIACDTSAADRKRKEAIEIAASPLAALEAALISFDSFKSKLDESIQIIEAQEGIGSKVQKARATVIEIMPKSKGLTGIGSYLTYLKHTNWANDQQLQLLRIAETHIPYDGQLIASTIERMKKSLTLLEAAEGKTIKEFAETVVQAQAEVSPEDIHSLSVLATSIEKSVVEIQKSGRETIDFHDGIKGAQAEGRSILSKL